jgi:MATE family multidrug resistance protein
VTGKEKWHREGGGRELLQLAVPFILSSSFLTLQLVIDRALLTHASSDAVAAAMPAALLYWTPMALLQNIANYATTFVAQYLGAGRPERVGPSVWQALYFSVLAGLCFLVLVPLAALIMALGGHSPSIQDLETRYFSILCFAALPALIVAAVNGFFAGRGASWMVLLVDAAGMSVNVVMAYGLILGHWGLPAWGIEGAGWATVAGSSTSAVMGLLLFLRRRYRAEFATLAGWRFDPELSHRLMRFGFPNGLLWMLDCVAFAVFIFLVGRLGDVELAASNVAFSIYMLAILPVFGLSQAISVLVGQRLGQDRPEVAARTVWTGFRLAFGYALVIAALYVLTPEPFMYFFRSHSDSKAPLVMVLVPTLLCFLAVYSAFDSMTIVFSFALRGAGDTRFVTAVALVLAWPLMVIPTWATLRYHWGGVFWAWSFASAYVIALGITFLLRFLSGKWKSMRVIEKAAEPEVEPVAVISH